VASFPRTERAIQRPFPAYMNPSHHTTRLAILLVSPEVSRRGGLTIAGHAEPCVSDSESVDFAELLSAANYPFDMVTPEEIQRELLVHGDSLNYSSLILAVPWSRLSPNAQTLIESLSREAGLSLIAAYDHPDDRSPAFFGIEQFKGRRLLRPLKVQIGQPSDKPERNGCVADYGVRSGFAGVRRRGLRRLSWRQTFTKGLNLLRNSRLPYMKAALAQGASVLMTTMAGEPLAWSYRFGNATNYYFALHGDLFLDKYNEVHGLVRSAIEANSGRGMVSVDLERTMVIRLDDPGAGKADFQHNGQLLNESEWDQLGHIVRERKIGLSVMYTPAWVDDADTTAGTLFVGNQPVTNRIAGDLHSSASVRYVFAAPGKGEHDHASEFRGLAALSRQQIVDVHSHGLTHLVPDHEAWAAAEDKRSDVRWYTEFYDTRQNRQIPGETQTHALAKSKKAIEELFHRVPAAITPSGHRHDSTCDILAHDAGYRLFSADYTGIFKERLLVRNWKIPALFLFYKDPTPSVARSGYPVIGVIHDDEIKGNLDRLCRVLDSWSEAGIERFISMNDLAAALSCSIHARYSKQASSITVDIDFSPAGGAAAPPAETEMVVKIALPLGSLCEPEGIQSHGATVISVKPATQNAISLLIRVHGSASVKIVIPVISKNAERHVPEPLFC
jgi:hypothetical protein